MTLIYLARAINSGPKNRCSKNRPCLRTSKSQAAAAITGDVLHSRFSAWINLRKRLFFSGRFWVLTLNFGGFACVTHRGQKKRVFHFQRRDAFREKFRSFKFRFTFFSTAWSFQINCKNYESKQIVTFRTLKSNNYRWFIDVKVCAKKKLRYFFCNFIFFSCISESDSTPAFKIWMAGSKSLGNGEERKS